MIKSKRAESDVWDNLGTRRNKCNSKMREEGGTREYRKTKGLGSKNRNTNSKPKDTEQSPRASNEPRTSINLVPRLDKTRWK